MSDGECPRVVVCRATDQAGPLVDRLHELGFDVVRLPLIEIEPPVDGGAALAAAVEQLGAYEWVTFTSTNAVDAVAQRCAGQGWPPATGVAAVGPATARACRSRGLPVTFVPSEATAATLGAELPDGSGTVLAPLGELAGDDLADTLTRRGRAVVRVDAYRSGTPAIDASALHRALEADAVLLSSPSSATRFAELSRQPDAGSRPVIAGAICIGPRTEARAVDCGLPVLAVADPHDDDGLVAAAVNTLLT